MIHLIGQPAHGIKNRCDKDRGQKRIEVETLVQGEGAISSKHHKGRMRDIRDVEQAEGDRRAGSDASVEPPQQKPGDDRVGKKVEGKHGMCSQAAA
jgi:hypothetical protein